MINVRKIETKADYDTFNELQGDELHVLKFSAEWCGPCKMLAETISHLDPNKIGTTLFAEIDVDNEDMEEVVSQFNIRNIPVLAFVKNGKVVNRTVGYITADEIYKKIEESK